MRQRLSSVLVLAAATVVVVLAVLAGVRSFRGGDEEDAGAPVARAVPRRTAVRPVKTGHPDFDIALGLPGSPQGIATDGRELLIGNRQNPWGVLRLERDGQSFESRGAQITEPEYNQKIQLSALTWNGTHYVGLTSAAWFTRGAQGEVFSVHHPRTLDIVSTHPAPPLLGCLAWDGTQYWAGTRRHTRDSPEPALLYRLDRTFRVLGTSAAPSAGCQGLAWDGRHLWSVDVFDDSIHVIDVSGPEPRVVRRAYVNVEYLSGIVAYDGGIWITDYGENRLQRLRPSSRIAWQGGGSPSTAPVIASAIASATETAGFDRHTNRFAKRPADNTELLDWSVALREGNLVAEWQLWFGPDLFVKREQTSPVALPLFARYEITARTPDGRETKLEYTATPGENAMRDVVLAPAVAAGTYRVSLFMHVQYVKPDGQGQILNHSAGSLEVIR